MLTCYTDGQPIKGHVFSYEVDGVKYLACTDCAIKADEIAFGEEFHQRSEMNSETVCTYVGYQK